MTTRAGGRSYRLYVIKPRQSASLNHQLPALRSPLLLEPHHIYPLTPYHPIPLLYPFTSFYLFNMMMIMLFCYIVEHLLCVNKIHLFLHSFYLL